ncbi:hypothetical protein [Desulfovibrio litoralis]|uniref:Uncharacterized protein n=1 Tax=Desulfovibrio litoralis DSM 11393 TaxID=1121455 RepID=A0A1M7SLP6_9BACT|nr:hypothetical protein [Desulfovibrio litoralis]SHN59412.1 hypothetical protein SAMN02745728_01007 [Desulfovibrio litoralis DSM 11393]
MLHSKFPFPLLGPESVDQMSFQRSGCTIDLETIANNPALNEHMWTDLMFLTEAMLIANETGLNLYPSTSRPQ